MRLTDDGRLARVKGIKTRRPSACCRCCPPPTSCSPRAASAKSRAAPHTPCGAPTPRSWPRPTEAAEGTRTLDLLHGKQTLIVSCHRFIPAYRTHRRLCRAGVCLRFRRVSSGFWHPIGTETRGPADVASPWPAPRFAWYAALRPEVGRAGDGARSCTELPRLARGRPWRARHRRGSRLDALRRRATRPARLGLFDEQADVVVVLGRRSRERGGMSASAFPQMWARRGSRSARGWMPASRPKRARAGPEWRRSLASE
jgi:hypothetical protein